MISYFPFGNRSANDECLSFKIAFRKILGYFPACGSRQGPRQDAPAFLHVELRYGERSPLLAYRPFRPKWQDQGAPRIRLISTLTILRNGSTNPSVSRSCSRRKINLYFYLFFAVNIHIFDISTSMLVFL